MNDIVTHNLMFICRNKRDKIKLNFTRRLCRKCKMYRDCQIKDGRNFKYIPLKIIRQMNLEAYYERLSEEQIDTNGGYRYI